MKQQDVSYEEMTEVREGRLIDSYLRFNGASGPRIDLVVYENVQVYARDIADLFDPGDPRCQCVKTRRLLELLFAPERPDPKEPWEKEVQHRWPVIQDVLVRVGFAGVLFARSYALSCSLAPLRRGALYGLAFIVNWTPLDPVTPPLMPLVVGVPWELSEELCDCALCQSSRAVPS